MPKNKKQPIRTSPPIQQSNDCGKKGGQKPPDRNPDRHYCHKTEKSAPFCAACGRLIGGF